MQSLNQDLFNDPELSAENHLIVAGTTTPRKTISTNCDSETVTETSDGTTTIKTSGCHDVE